MYGFTLIAVLVIVGGIIAFIGDKIGMKVGRKRLTLFGLRPKHTSIIITIATGILIAGVSLGVLSVASQDVRTALFDMKEIQAALAETQSELGEKSELLEEQNSLLQEAIALRDQAQRDKLSLEEEKRRLQSELAALEKQIASVKDELAQKQEELEYEKARVDQLVAVGKRLEMVNQELERIKADLEAQYNSLLEQRNALERALRTGKSAYLKDQIVASAVIEGGKPWEAMRDELLNGFLLGVADKLAAQRLGVDAGNVLLLRDQATFIDAVTLLSSKGKQQWVVRARAANNVVYGEDKVVVWLELFDNRKVFSRGQVIAERTIDGSRIQVQEEVFALLQAVNEAALEAGMMTYQEDVAVGQVPVEDVIETIGQIREAGGPVRVVAVAEEDAWRAQPPLKIRLEVRERGS